jgi:hypothetical protein
MKFTLTIDLGNDAMSTRGDVRRVLERTAGVIAEANDGHFTHPGHVFPVKDTNGNTVGSWTVEEPASSAQQFADSANAVAQANGSAPREDVALGEPGHYDEVDDRRFNPEAYGLEG